jgi:hypothetical protein
MTTELFLFDPNSKWSGIYSNMHLDNTGRWRTAFGGETLEELIAESKVSPEAVLLPWREAEARSSELARQRLCKGPQRVSRERWWELLEVLYPARWEATSEFEVFMVPECIAADLYTFGVRINEDYFCITESCNIDTSDLVQQCLEVVK